MSTDDTIAAGANDLTLIKVNYEEGEKNPWSLDYHDVSLLQAARAALNYPVTHFESRDKAVEVALMVRDIIKADAVQVEGEDDLLFPRDEENKANFFEQISPDGSGLTEDLTDETPVSGSDPEPVVR